MAEYDLKLAVPKLRNKRLNFGFYRGKEADQILITPQPASPKQIAELEKECGESKRVAKGVAFYDKDQLVFATKTTPSPQWETQMTKVFKDRKCSQFLPLVVRQLGPNEPEEVSAPDGDTAAAPAPQSSGTIPTPPSPPPPAPPADPQHDAWLKLKAALTPQIADLVKSARPDKATLLALAKSGMEKEKTGDFQGATADFTHLAQLLSGGTGGNPPPSAPPTPPKYDPAQLLAALNKLSPAIKTAITSHPALKDDFTRLVGDFQTKLKSGQLDEARSDLMEIGALLKSLPTAPVGPGAGENGGKGKNVLYTQARLAWDNARKRVRQELEQVEAAIVARYQGEPTQGEAKSKAAKLFGILDSLDERLLGKLDEAYNADTDEKVAGFRKEAAAITAEYLAFANSDPLVNALDKNAFAPVPVKAGLVETLNQLSSQLA